MNNRWLALIIVSPFLIGLTFGSIGHFFSILCFPLLAALTGLVIAEHLSDKTPDNKNNSIGRSLVYALLAATFFLLGLFLGVIFLVLILIPRVAFYQDSLFVNYYNTAEITKAFVATFGFGMIYAIIFVLIALSVSVVFKKGS